MMARLQVLLERQKPVTFTLLAVFGLWTMIQNNKALNIKATKLN